MLPTLTTLYASFPFCVPWYDFAAGVSKWVCSSPPAGFGSGTGNLSTFGSTLTSLMNYVFVIAGIVLLLMIIASGYTLLTSVGNPEAIEKGKSRLTASLIGFIIIFAAFWLLQIIEVFLGVPGTFTG